MAEYTENIAFDHVLLHEWTSAMFAARGLPAADAEMVAEGLLDGDLRGVPTHGMAQMGNYLSLLDKGVTNPCPDIRIMGEGSLVFVEAGRALGQVVVRKVIDALTARTRTHSMSGATVANAGHLGGLGYFARIAAEAGLISIVLQNGPPMMGMLGSTGRGIGNNPLAFSAPVPDGPPVLFDIATSEAAFGKIIKARAAGASEIPAGWALDRYGMPTTDPAAALEGIMVPLGGAKGIGLAMMVEVLAGSLSGTTPVAGENLFGAFVLLVDPLAVQTREAFEDHMARWIATYRQSGPDARYPGERAAALRAEQLQSGVILSRTLARDLARLGTESGLRLPLAI